MKSSFIPDADESPFADVFDIGIPAVQKYFEDSLDSVDDEDVKKVVAAGTIIAHKRYGPKTTDGKPCYTDEELTQIAEGGVSTAKVVYKVGTGELEAVDAIDHMVDTGTAIAGAVVKTAAEQAGGAIGTKVGSAIGGIFGPAGAVVGAKIGDTVGRLGGKLVGEVIVPAVKKVAGFVKEVAHTAWEGIKNVASAVVEGVSNVVSGVGDFISGLFGWW